MYGHGIGLLFIFVIATVTADDVNVLVEEAPAAPFHHFWRSTGLCPPLPHTAAGEFLLSKDESLNLQLIGSLPYDGIQQVRIHWLLQLIHPIKITEDSVVYNFTDLDSLVSHLHRFKLTPGFEIMGNPGGIFTDFLNKTQVTMWSGLIRTIAKRYIMKYGLDYVSRWNFETWNEPDNHDFDNTTFTTQGWLNYAEASRSGLNSASPLLKFGGPGGSCWPPHKGKQTLCSALLTAADNYNRLSQADYSTNYLKRLGRKPDRKHPNSISVVKKKRNRRKGKCNNTTPCIKLDYIAIHKKGHNDSMSIIALEMNTTKWIYNNYKHLRETPLVNDEGDPLVGWSRPLAWRGDVRYAALVAGGVIQHQHYMVSKYKQFTLLSNDNGFLNYNPHFFTQRTLLTRFQMNNTTPRHTQFIEKPVYSVMALLALTGDQLIKTSVDLKNNLHYIVTSHEATSVADPSYINLLFTYYNNISLTESHKNVNLTINTNRLDNGGDLMLTVYTLNNKVSNPSKVWEDYGSPVFPDSKVRQAMRDVQGPYRVLGPLFLPSFLLPYVNMSLNLEFPSVTMVHICAKSQQPPGMVVSVSLVNITVNEVLITWSDENVQSRCIATYEVEHSANSSLAYTRINPEDRITNSYHYAPTNPADEKDNVVGWYRVRAVDYWGRPGQYSPPVKFQTVQNA